MPFNDLFSTFADNLLPILLISGAGFLLGKIFPIDSRSVGRIVFYIFSPILVFDLLLNTKLNSADIFKTMLFTIIVGVVLGITALLLGKVLAFERPMLMAIILTAAFPNTGNYGLPLVSFAFGQDALAYATLYFVTTSILFNTAGVLIASLGHMNFKEAFAGLFKVPTVYAVIIASALNHFQIILPTALSRTVDLAANGSIPIMIILLGLELSRVQWSHSIRAVGLSASLRLLAGPLIGFLLAIAFGLQGAARQGNIVESSMPAAVTTTVLATEYGLDTSLVTAIVFVGTILSPLTLTPLLFFLRR
jgi:malate permease and related proteins